jgi:predicted AAA+ superfamily ATPase
MAHPYLDIAFETLKSIINDCGDSRIIFIVGPTGVGKTKLRLLIEKWGSFGHSVLNFNENLQECSIYKAYRHL